MTEGYRAASVLGGGAGECFVPSEIKIGGIDDEFRYAGIHEPIHRVLDERFIENRHEGFREYVGQRSQSGAETCAEYESLHFIGMFQ